METVDRDFRNNVIVTGVTQFLIVLCYLIISIILARAFTVEGRGIYSLALLVPSFLAIFISFGIGEATANLLGKEKYPKDKIIGCLHSYILIYSVISAVIYYGLAQFILRILKHNLSWQLYYVSFMIIPIGYFWNGYSAVLLALGKIKQVGVGRLINNLFFITLCLASFSIFKPLPLIAIAIFIIAYIIELIYFAYVIKEYIKVGFCFNKRIMKEQIIFGLKFSLGTIFANINKRLDTFFVNAFVGIYGVGLYAIAVGLTEFLLNIPHIFGRVAFSYTVSLKDSSGTLTTKAIRQSMFLLFVISILLGVFLKWIIQVFYTDKFSGALLPAMILLPGIVTLGLSIIIGLILTGCGKPEESAKAMGISSIFTVILDLVLIPRFGIIGASFASTVSYTCSACYLLIAYKKFSHKTISEILFIKSDDFKDYLIELKKFVFWKK